MNLEELSHEEIKDWLHDMMENWVDHSDHSKIPERMIAQISEYVEKGTPLCSFLEALFSNDLFDCFGRADIFNTPLIPYYINYVYNYCPHSCHGSRDAVKAWCEKGGLCEKS